MTLTITIILILITGFGLMAMSKNERLLSNRWLFYTGWFFVARMAITILYYGTAALAELGFIEKVYFNVFYNYYSHLLDLVFPVGFIFYALYLFSLNHPCLRYSNIFRTLKFLIRKK